MRTAHPRGPRCRTTADPHEPVPVAHWQRLEGDGVYYCKNRGVHADAHRDGEDGEQSKPAVPPQNPHGVTCVLPQRLHPRQTAALAVLLLELGDASKCDARGSGGRFGSHAASEIVVHEHVEMGTELRVEIHIDAVRPEPPRHTRRKDFEPLRHGCPRCLATRFVWATHRRVSHLLWDVNRSWFIALPPGWGGGPSRRPRNCLRSSTWTSFESPVRPSGCRARSAGT